jgi:Tol biopolymer transport system component
MLDGPYGGLDSLYVVSLDGGIPRRIADGVWGPRPPAWSPDDRWIIVARTRIGTGREHSSIASDRHLWLVNPDGGSLQQIEFGPRPDAAATGESAVESAVPR